MEEVLVQDRISSAYDSFNLIMKFQNLSSLSKDQEDSLGRNIDHIKIMLIKDDFVNELDAYQLNDLKGVLK